MYTSSPCKQIISASNMPNRAEILKQKFMQSLGLPWQTLLTESRLEEILKEENVFYRHSVYTPVVTLWAMVSQV